jgi:thermostable 8-oxoguanine DNA glycosylase
VIHLQEAFTSMGGDQATMATGDVVQTLLDRYGQTFAEEAKIDLGRDEPGPLFSLLCLSLLISARISARIAMQAAHALTAEGWSTADRLGAATWEERARVLNDAGYARYDESTSRYLGATAELVLERYDGDLRQLRREADGDRAAMRDALIAFRGIGDVGASFFLREVQVVWDELVPFADDRVLQSAAALHLPQSAAELLALVDDHPSFSHLVAGLVRVGLANDHEAILEAAGH